MLSILGTHPLETFLFLVALFLILFNLDKIFPKEFTDYDRIKMVAKMNDCCKPADVFILAYNAYGPHKADSGKARDDIVGEQEHFLECRTAYRYERTPWMKAFMDEHFASWEEQEEKAKKRRK